MGSSCTKTPEPPPGANRQVVVENAAFDSVHAAEGSGGDAPSLASSPEKKKKGKKKKPSGGKQKKKKKNGTKKESQQPPPLPPARAATDCNRCKSKVQFCNCDVDSSHPAQQQAVARVQRLELSSNALALKCAGLGLDDGYASYADSGAAKVKKAIVKLREGKAATAAALVAFKKTQQVPQELLELAQGEVLRAIGVTRFGVLNAEVQWKEQGKRDGSRVGEAVIKDRQTLLDALKVQIEFASKLGIATLVEKDAALNAAVDAAASASAVGSFATTVEIATDTGLDMRLVAGVLALRGVTSEVAKNAVYFDAGSHTHYGTNNPKPLNPVKIDSWYSKTNHHNPDFSLFKTRLEILHATATALQDKAAVAATNALFRIFPGFATAKLDAMAELVPAILKDVAIYNEIFKAIVSSTPQANFDELKSLAATPSQLPDWKSRIKNHPGDPAPDSLEYLIVARHRAADDSITFYNSVHTILTTKLPGGCQAAAMPGLVKAEQRIIFKTALSYSGEECFSRCNDIVRLTVRVETLEELLMVLKSFLGSEDILVLRQKHRLDPDKDMSMIGGYRDYQLLVAFKRDAASVAKDGGPEYAVGEIQINLANFIDIKEGVAAGGGGGHGPYKLARSFNGYSPETVEYVGAPSMALAEKIEGGMLLSVTIAHFSETGDVQVFVDQEQVGAAHERVDAALERVDDLEEVAAAMGKALESKKCRVQTFAFGRNGVLAKKMLTSVTETAASVKSMDLAGARQLTMLPEGLSKLANLQSLNLSGCKKLTMLPEWLSKLVNLQSLNLSGCKNLTMLPEGLSKLANLQSLNLSECKTLVTVPDLSHLLPNLKIENVPHHLSCWEEQHFVDLMDATNLTKTTALRFVFFGGTEMPGWFSKLVNHGDLESLDLSWCQSLTKLPECLSKLVNLQSLNLSFCSTLTMLPEWLGELVNLQSLNLENCWNLTTLPEGLSKLANLQSLNLSRCESLVEPLPDVSHPPPSVKGRRRLCCR